MFHERERFTVQILEIVLSEFRDWFPLPFG
jgi:hypothetical protein